MLAVFHNKSVQALSGWVGLMTFAYAILGSLTPKWFGTLSWPQLILAGLICAILSALILAITFAAGAWAFRLLRPHATTLSAAERSAPAVVPYDDTDLKIVVEGLAQTVRTVIDDYQRMSGIEAKLSDRINNLETCTQEGIEASRRGFEVLEDQMKLHEDAGQKIEMIRVDGAIATKEIGKINDYLSDKFKRIQESLVALRSRERLAAWAAVINRDAEDLYDRLKSGEIYDAVKWQQWENVHSHWNEYLGYWLDLATWYGIAIKEKTLTVDDEKYADGWTVSDNQFPDSEAVRRFKKFRIVHTQWEGVIDNVMAGVDSVAFVGMSEEQVRRGTSAG